MKRRWFESYGRAALYMAALRAEFGIVATMISDEVGGFIVEWNEE